MLSLPVVLTVSLLALLALWLVLAMPRSTQLSGGSLRIQSPLKTWEFALADIVEAPPYRIELLHTIRLFAVGWPLPPVGILRDREGRFRALASSRTHLHMLRFRNGRRLLVSLADAEALKPAALESYPAS